MSEDGTGLWSRINAAPQADRGNGPPQNISASELWARLNESPRPHRIVDFPRLSADGTPIGQVAMWVLTQEEQMICASAAQRFAKEKVKDGKREDIGYETVYSNQSVVEILYRACRRADDVTLSAFPSPALIRERLTADECSVLFEKYLSVQLDLGPIVTAISKDEYEAWVERIAEGGLAASPFVLLSWEMQRLLAHFMACQIQASRTGSSSAGSPLDETPPSSAASDETDVSDTET